MTGGSLTRRSSKPLSFFLEGQLFNIFRQMHVLPSVVLPLMLSIVLAMTFAASEALEPADPFGAPPKGTSPNCGPERRLKLDIVVSSKDKFIEILRNINNYVSDNGVRQWTRFDNFKNEGSKEVNWKAVAEAIKISSLADRTIYSVDYTPHGCSLSQKFTIKITNDGHMSLYGCCGK